MGGVYTVKISGLNWFNIWTNGDGEKPLDSIREYLDQLVMLIETRKKLV
jgi:hypothetical protein